MAQNPTLKFDIPKLSELGLPALLVALRKYLRIHGLQAPIQLPVGHNYAADNNAAQLRDFQAHYIITVALGPAFVANLPEGVMDHAADLWRHLEEVWLCIFMLVHT